MSKRRLPLVALVLFPAMSLAQPAENEATKEYDLQVVLRCGSHNWLGKAFRDDLRGNLTGMLSDALGAMARVEVVDLKEQKGREKWPQHWLEVDARGLGSLDAVRAIGTGKTHFVLVDFVNGQYEIQARQVDGQTGLVSPLRYERTTDRAFIARLAGKLIAQDFGLIGTIRPKGPAANGEVPSQITFKAGGLGVPLGRWVQRGDVFTLLLVSSARGEGGREIVNRIGDTVAVVTANEVSGGDCEAQVVFRGTASPFQRFAGQNFRCIKMAAIPAPMRLRLVNDKGQPHTRTLQVAVHPKAFQTGPVTSAEEVLNPDRGGMFVSKTPYDRVAFVRIITGGTEIARMPVPIEEDRAVTVTVGLDAATETAGQLQALRGQLRRQYSESESVQFENYKAISKLVTDTNNTKALDMAKSSLLSLEKDLERLKIAKDDVKKQIAGTNITVADCDQAELDLREIYMRKLHRIIGQLEDTIRLDNAPDKVERRQKLQNLLNQIEVLQGSDDYDGAIALYRKIVMDYPEETKVKDALDRLEREWAIKSADHQTARTFFYREWPAVKTSAEIAAKLPAARQHMQTLSQVRDHRTMLKLRGTVAEIGKVLRAEIAAVAQEGMEDADKSAKLKKIVEDFDKFVQDMETALKTAAGG